MSFSQVNGAEAESDSELCNHLMNCCSRLKLTSVNDRGGFPCVQQYSCFPWFALLSQRGKRFEGIRMAHCIDDGNMHAVTCIRKLDLKNV
ncbi:hypothetical protein POTOM_045822 [Populus tomentosa]|uniref:Uncharacterized protein n=1 Tax=Populus tomentosa TaxID=118781 RepID=A0A8X8CEK0_POPTO|nr:hypothetical protein POTOM_045822 [Populus tomentosa]